MKRTSEYLQQRLEACRKLYFEYNGREHARLEREMRAGGFPDFNRRCLYARGVNSGWIEKYRWDVELQYKVTVLSQTDEAADTTASIGDPTSRQRRRQIVAPGEAERSPGYGAQQDPSHRTSGRASSMALPGSKQRRRRRSTNRPLNEFHCWIKKVSPAMFDWDAKHLRLLIKTLQLVTEGKIKRLMIFMPPRHGKSEPVTIRYTAWRLMKDPTLKVILASYAQALANRFSRNIRNTLAEHFSQTRRTAGTPACNGGGSSQDQAPAPNNTSGSQTDTALAALGGMAGKGARVPTDDDPPLSNPFRSQIINSAQEWETGKGGGVKAVGVGGGITGYGAGLMMIDDPIKSREQAESQAYRDKVWQWFNDDMMTRLEPDAPVILIQTRWHEDDLAGRLLKQQQEDGTDEWHVISLPAIAETVDSGQWSVDSAGSGSPPYERGVDADSADGVVLSATPKPTHPVKLMPARQLAFTTMPPYIPGKSYGDIIREREEAKEAAQRREAETQSLHCRSLQRTDNDPLKDPGLQPNTEMGLKPRDPFETTGPLPKGNGNVSTGSGSDRGFLSANTHNSINSINSPNSPNSPDPLGRRPGEALWPARFDIKQLEKIKRQMGTYSFEALYQQKPVPTEGGMFKRSWFANNIVQVPPPNLNWKRGYDLSFTANPDSDPSATLKVAYDKDGVLYIDGCFRAKLTYPLQRKMLMHYIKTETRTEHGIELSANGHALLQDLRQMPDLRGKKFRGVKVDSNKLTRALPWIALAEERRVRLVAGRWNEDFIAEACSFPHGHHDDQIDAVSVAVAMHGNSSGKRFWRF